MTILTITMCLKAESGSCSNTYIIWKRKMITDYNSETKTFSSEDLDKRNVYFSKWLLMWLLRFSKSQFGSNTKLHIGHMSCVGAPTPTLDESPAKPREKYPSESASKRSHDVLSLVLECDIWYCSCCNDFSSIFIGTFGSTWCNERDFKRWMSESQVFAYSMVDPCLEGTTT